MSRSFKITLLALGIPLGLFLLPWLLLFLLSSATMSAGRQAGERAKESVDLADAICQLYATPERVAHCSRKVKTSTRRWRGKISHRCG